MSPRLVAEEGILKGVVLPLEEGEEWTIGRDPESCQILLEDPSASRRHLLCRKTPEGILLENLSHTNPVKVNDEEVTTPRLLQEGDLVQIGSGIYRFFLEQEPTSAPSSVLEEEQKKAASAMNEIEETPAELVENHFESSDESYDSVVEEGEIGNHKFAEINFDLRETGRWLLKVVSGPNHGAEFSMHPNETYLVGTDPNTCDIVFHDTSVSRQHARISISENEEIFVEDLKSRNGTLIDGEPIKEKTPLSPNTIVSMGTTSFVVYDREGNMQTIISPLLPSIVKVLQREEKEGKKEEAPLPELPQPTSQEPPKHERHLGPLILIGIVTGVFVLSAIGVTALFKTEPVTMKEIVEPDKAVQELLAPFPTIKYSFSKSQGRLVLFGHLLTAQDKTQLLYSLQALNFIKSIDDSGVIIDEYVWQETNQVLNKNPNWRSITLQSPQPGQFILTGTLQNRKQAESLSEYITNNFPYLDRLERRIVVEEEIVYDAKAIAERGGAINVTTSFRDGELTITGGVPELKQESFLQAVEEIKKMPGVRNVRLQITNLAPEQSMINISDRYEVSGFSRIGNTISVVVNGRIVTKNDVLDGMVIKEITPGTILLEKDGVKYRIDFSK